MPVSREIQIFFDSCMLRFYRNKRIGMFIRYMLMIAVIIAVAFFMGTSRQKHVRLWGQGLLLASSVSLFIAAIFALLYPIFNAGDGYAVWLVSVVPLLFVSVIPWFLLQRTRKIHERRVMTEDIEQSE